MYAEHHRKLKQREATKRYRDRHRKPRVVSQLFDSFPTSDLAWAAGLFEGEGTVTIAGGGKRPYTRVLVSITSTDYEIVKFFVDRWPGQLSMRRAINNARQHWTWRLSCRKAAMFLVQIRPFIQTKRVRDKVELALVVQSIRRQGARNGCLEYRDMHDRLKMIMRRLNRRGMSKMVLLDGQTVAEMTLPAIEAAYASGKQPKGLLVGW